MTKKVMEALVVAAVGALALFLFTSLSLSAAYHILIAVAGLFYFWKHLREFKAWPASVKGLAALIVAVYLSLLANFSSLAHPWLHFSKTKYFILGLLGWVAIAYGGRKLKETKTQKILLRIFLYASTAATLSGIYALYYGFNPLRFRPTAHLTRASGMYGMTTTYSFSVAALAVIILVLLKHYQKMRPLVGPITLASCALLALWGLYLSSGRGAIVGLGYAIPFIVFLRHRAWLVTGLVSISVALGAYLYLNESGHFKKYSKLPNSLGRQLGHDSGLLRKTHLKAAYYMLKENPILGVGFRAVEEKIVPIKYKYNLPWPEFQGHAHNNVLEIWAGLGTVGLIAFLWFFCSWWAEAYRRGDVLGDATVAFLAYYVVSGLFHSAIIDGEVLFFFFGLYSLHAVKYTTQTSGVQS